MSQYIVPSQERLDLRVLAQDHRIAARLHLAFKVEQTARALGLDLSDDNGDGPFIQAVRANGGAR